MASWMLSLVALAVMVSSCNRKGGARVDVHRNDGPAAAVPLPVTTAYCTPACVAAGAVDCQRMYNRLCNDSTEGYVSVGGYVLKCADALRSSCAGGNVGVPACVAACTRPNGDGTGNGR
jgi:hypothetical protein